MQPHLPCHRGSSLRIFSIMAWLAAPADWPSMLPSTVVCPFCKASMAWSSLGEEDRTGQSELGGDMRMKELECQPCIVYSHHLSSQAPTPAHDHRPVRHPAHLMS